MHKHLLISVIILFFLFSVTLLAMGSENKVIKWHETFDNNFSISPININGIVYGAIGEKYYALDTSKGDILWKKNLSFYPSANVSHNKYICLTDFRKINVLSSENGNSIWSYEVKDFDKKDCYYNFDYIFINENNVFVVKNSQNILCFDIKRGKKIWSQDFEGWKVSSINIIGDRFYTLITDYSKDQYMLRETDVKTGKILKARKFGLKINPSNTSCSFIDDNILIIGKSEIKVFSLKNWEFKKDYSATAKDNHKLNGKELFYSKPDHTLASININTGKTWDNSETAPKVYELLENFLVSENDKIYYVYGANREGICAIDRKNGSVIWKKEYKGTDFYFGIVDDKNGGVLYGITGHEAIIIDKSNGEIKGNPLDLGNIEQFKWAEVINNELIVVTQDSILSTGNSKLKDHHFYGSPSFYLSTDHYYARGAKAYFYGTNIDYIDWKAYEVKNFKIENGHYVYDKKEALKGKADFEGTLYFPCTAQSKSKTVTLPLTKPGIYLIKATARGVGDKNATSEAIISNLATVVKFTPEQILVFANNLASNIPQKDAKVRIYLNNKLIEEGITDEKGLFLTELKEPANGDMTIFTQYNGNYSIYTSNNREPQKKYQAYVYTERPIYRPGHTVYFKGIIRKDIGDSYENLSYKQVKVKIYDPLNNIVYDGKHVSNKFGSFAGKYNIKDNASLGTYNIVTTINDDISYYATFSVEEYRKPEYKVTLTPSKRSYLQGEDDAVVDLQADYYFGAPVCNATVRYIIRSSPYYYSFSSGSPEESWYGDDSGTYYYSYPDEYVQESEGVTDSRGHLKIKIPVKKNETNRLYTIEASVVDLSRREVEASTSFISTTGEFFIGTALENYVYSPGDKAKISFKARDIFNTPVETELHLNFLWRKWNSERKSFIKEVFHEDKIKLDKNGNGEYIITLPGEIPSDNLIVEAEALDGHGNIISASSYAWITGGAGENNNYPSLEIITDKKLYSYGDKAKILININSLKEPEWALICTERNRIENFQVIKLEKSSTFIELPIKETYSPNVYLTVSFISKGQLVKGTKLIAVPAKDKFINISVKTDKDRYLPGEDATISVKTTDFSGKPLQAEVSLGLVDEALYAIKPDLTMDIRKFFYGKKENYVNTGYSIPEELSAGGVQKVPQSVKVRENFKDTAYWNPFVITDEKGEAKVTVTLPDNLTTWRATARGITENTLVGSAISKTIVGKKLLVRLTLPRFLSQKDELTVSGVIHNNSGKGQKIKALLEAEGVTIVDEKEKTIDISDKGASRVDWKIKVNEFPERGKAVFTVYAVTGEEEFSDAMKLTIPVLPHGQEFVEGESGKIKWRYVKLIDVPKTSLDGSTEVEVSIAPSLVGNLFKSLDYLAAYPYGCVEQTMSCFLPDIFIMKIMKETGMENKKLSAKLPDMIKTGLKKLYSYQHSDGGWGWWERDSSNPYLTALVVYGLSEAKKAGIPIKDGVIANGIYALGWLDDNTSREIAEMEGKYKDMEKAIGLLKKQGKDDKAENLEKELNYTKDYINNLYSIRTYMLFATITADGTACNRSEKIKKFFDKRDKLNNYTKALLAISCNRTGKKDMAKKILDEILSAGIVSKNTCHWESRAFHYGWFDNQVETTAYVLKAMMEIDGKNEKILPTVTWLIENKQGGAYWTSTKDTASAIYILSEYVKHSKELKPDYMVKVYMNNKKIKEFKVTEKNIGDDPEVIRFTSKELLKGKKNKLEITREGAGEVYYTYYYSTYAYSEKLSPQDNGFRVTREYCITMPSTKQSFKPVEILHPISWDMVTGKEFKVKLNIEGKPSYQYIMVEDYIPAGCEIVAETDDSRWINIYYSRRENRDNRVVFFLNDMAYSNGKAQIVYTLRAETPGIFNAMPARVEMMYNPHIKGSSGKRVIVIKDK